MLVVLVPAPVGVDEPEVEETVIRRAFLREDVRQAVPIVGVDDVEVADDQNRP